MSNSLDITVEEARDIVIGVALSKGCIRPELHQSQNKETREVLGALRRVRESLGDAVEMYAQLEYL